MFSDAVKRTGSENDTEFWPLAKPLYILPRYRPVVKWTLLIQFLPACGVPVTKTSPRTLIFEYVAPPPPPPPTTKYWTNVTPSGAVHVEDPSFVNDT